MAHLLGTVPGPIGTAPGQKTHISGTAATMAAGTTGVGAGSDWVINVVCTAAFNITFSADGTSAITDPANNSAFPAGAYRWRLCSKNSHFEFTPAANCTLTHWLDRA